MSRSTLPSAASVPSSAAGELATSGIRKAARGSTRERWTLPILEFPVSSSDVQARRACRPSKWAQREPREASPLNRLGVALAYLLTTARAQVFEPQHRMHQTGAYPLPAPQHRWQLMRRQPSTFDLATSPQRPSASPCRSTELWEKGDERRLPGTFTPPRSSAHCFRIGTLVVNEDRNATTHQYIISYDHSRHPEQ